MQDVCVEAPPAGAMEAIAEAVKQDGLFRWEDCSTLHHIAKVNGHRYEIRSCWPRVFQAWVIRVSDELVVASTWFNTYREAEHFLECQASFLLRALA